MLISIFKKIVDPVAFGHRTGFFSRGPDAIGLEGQCSAMTIQALLQAGLSSPRAPSSGPRAGVESLKRSSSPPPGASSPP